MEYQKAKSAAKRVLPRGQELNALKLGVVDIIAQVVGGTLGPGGRPVLIERYEHDLPPIVTKDGVTVFQSLGFENPVQHCIMEAARDAAVRTAKEAGDGTTTATILAAEIVRQTYHYCARNPHESPQRTVQAVAAAFRDRVVPLLEGMALPAGLGDEAGRGRLRAVARVSANGDDDLAGAVLGCFDVCGDEGNVTLLEATGPTAYHVEKVEGYPIARGLEQSARQFLTMFVNEPELGRCSLDAPLFLLYHGKLTDWGVLAGVLQRFGEEWGAGRAPRNYVVVACGFGEQVLGNLGVGFGREDTLRVVPLVAPELPVPNSQLAFLEDLAAVVGAEIYDPLSRPLDTATWEGLGAATVDGVRRGRVRGFEMYLRRSSVIGRADADEVVDRVDQLREVEPEGELEARFLAERIAALSGGIARLKIFGMSNGETKERRDRAEDAVCAVRGALRKGILPGGGWALLATAAALRDLAADGPVVEILAPALEKPVMVLFENAGYSPDERDALLRSVRATVSKGAGEAVAYDLARRHHVLAVEEGLFDSTPAVLEAVRNAVSIATLIGTMGGAVVFARDHVLERSEAEATSEFLRHANYVDEHP